MEYKLNEQQDKLLNMLKWFHNFCESKGLKYYALGGTMLGTIRHNGFIPWDDDIDIGMPRSDYEQFISYCKDLKGEKYVVETIRTKATDYYYGYTKIYDTDTTLIEKTRKNIKRGIYLDLFPLDGAGNTKEEAEKIFKSVHWKYQLVMARTCAILPRRKWYKNLVILLARLIPSVLLNNKKQLLKIDSLCQTKKYEDSLLIANFLGNWGMKEIFPKAVMGEPTLYKFENIEIYGVYNFEEYLESLYGDWRKIPPEEKRVSLHDYIECDLNKSYLEIEEV